ncbi:MAG: RecQ family ATP-dependent DNA helicase [Bacteroidota bacterium]
MTPKEILHSFFGFEEFRPGQEEIITSIINRKNVLAVLPTGGGKSICYQIPALMLDSFSVVISPLIALMKDQVDSINQKQKVAAFINSTLEYRETNNIIADISNGKVKLLYVSPEKLNSIQFCESIKNLRPVYLFVDEAHCISEWGHSFRPSYRKIKSFADMIGFKSISAFTATATADVRNDIINQLGMGEPEIFVKGFERENLFLNVITTKNKKEKVYEIIKQNELPGIIYTATRKSAEEVTEYLRLKGVEAIYYHAGISSELRKIIQEDFQKNRVKLIVATNAFGMGIDKSDIRTLIHFQLPANIENYYQEIGRAGRDGANSKIYLLYDDNDKLIQEYFIKNSFPSREQIGIVYNAICDYGSIAFASNYNKDILLDKNLISFLESKGVTKGLMESSVKILSDSGYLLQSMDSKRHKVQSLYDPKNLLSFIRKLENNDAKDLLLILTREYGNSFFVSGVFLNLSRLSILLDESIEHIIGLIKSLNLSGIILYQQPSVYPSVRVLGNRIKSDNLELNYERTKDLVKNSRHKLELMLNYIYTKECRFKFILEYFGQYNTYYKCSKCDVCTGTNTKWEQSEFIEHHIVDLINEMNAPLTKGRIINILAGKSVEYNNLTAFGSCSHFAKTEIENTFKKMEGEKRIFSKKGLYQLTKGYKEELTSTIKSNQEFENELIIFNMLRQIRKEASAKFNQPVQLICPDDVLLKIAREKPSTASDLLEIEGFNKRMFNKIGEQFLEVIKESGSDISLIEMIKKKKLPENILPILELIKKKYSLEDISKLTKLSDTLLSIQIESLIAAIPDLDVEYLFNKNDLEEIESTINKGITDLKRLREALKNKFSYSLLRIALAKRRVSL